MINTFGTEIAFFVTVCLATPNVITTTTNATARQPEFIPSAAPSSHTPAPEPGPDWPVAKRQWGIIWELHWIGLGLVYALLACRSLWAIIRSPDTNSFARKHLYHAINWLLVALGTTRSLYLWIDPYESGENIVRCPLWIVRPLFGIAFPCLMSAFCLVHVAFLEVAKIQIGSPKLRRLRFVVTIILVHFAVVIASDTTTAFKADRTELLIVCQSFFIVWGLLNSFCFIYSGSKVIIKAHNVRNKICELENVEYIQKEEPPNDYCGPVKGPLKNEETAKHEEDRPGVKRSDAKDTCTIQQRGFGNNLIVQSAKQKTTNQDPKPSPEEEEGRPHFKKSGTRDTYTIQQLGFGNTLTVQSAKQKTTKQDPRPSSEEEEGRPRLKRSGTKHTCKIQQLELGNTLTVNGAKQKTTRQDSKPSPSRYPAPLPRCRERAIQKVARITLVTSVLSITCCALQIYSLFGVYSIYSKTVSPKPWPWLAFQTSFRVVELSMAYTLSHCVLRSGVGGRRGILTWLFNLRSTRKGRGPRIPIVQVKDVVQGDIPKRIHFDARL